MWISPIRRPLMYSLEAFTGDFSVDSYLVLSLSTIQPSSFPAAGRDEGSFPVWLFRQFSHQYHGFVTLGNFFQAGFHDI